MVTTVLALQFYNVTKEVTIQRDASSPGLGAVLKQDGYPITLERKYAYIKKERLAIVFPSTKFDKYIYKTEPWLQHIQIINLWKQCTSF